MRARQAHPVGCMLDLGRGRDDQRRVGMDLPPVQASATAAISNNDSWGAAKTTTSSLSPGAA